MPNESSEIISQSEVFTSLERKLERGQTLGFLMRKYRTLPKYLDFWHSPYGGTNESISNLSSLIGGKRVFQEIAKQGRDREKVKSFLLENENRITSFIKNGQAKWVCDILDDSELDVRQSIPDFFSDLVKAGEGAWVLSRIEQVNLLNDIPRRLPHGNLRSLIALLAKYGHSQWIVDRMDQQDIRMTINGTLNDRCIDYYRTLAEHGKADWVAHRIEADRYQFAECDGQIGILVRSLARNGQAKWVAEKFSAYDFNISRNHDTWLLIALAENGMSKWVADKLGKLEPYALRNEHIRNIVQTLIENGQANWFIDIQKNIDIDLREDMHVKLLTRLVWNGQAKWVMELLAQEGIGKIRDEHMCRELLIALIENGEAHTVLSLFSMKEISIWGDILLIRLLVEAGESEWVNKHFSDYFSSRENAFIFNEPLPASDSTAMNKIDSDMLKKREALREATKDEFTRKITELQSIYGMQDAERDEFLSRIVNIIQDASYQVLYFLNVAIREHGPFSQPILKFLDSLEQGNRSFVFDIHKSGSRLQIFGRPYIDQGRTQYEILFLNDIPTKSAETWIYAAQKGIPVAPIIKSEKIKKPGSTRVYSRYCGITYAEIMHLQMNEDAYSKHFLMLRERIIHQLKAYNIAHEKPHKDHTHSSNFTVEFIDKNWLTEARNQGDNINFMQPPTDKVTFDPSVFAADPDRWEPVMRLIDWDQGSMIDSEYR